MENKNCFIFDMDGTVFSTQTDFHAKAEATILQEVCNIKVRPEEISARFAGIATRKVFQELAPGFDANPLITLKWEMIHQLANEKDIPYLPGMLELILFLENKGIPIGIGSASPKHWIEVCLRKNLHPIDKLFGDRVVSGDEVKNTKPAPDIFLLTIERMFKDSHHNISDFSPVVIGDGRSDVLAGLAMNAQVLYLSSSNTEFDNHKLVKRFRYSEKLSDHVLEKLI